MLGMLAPSCVVHQAPDAVFLVGLAFSVFFFTLKEISLIFFKFYYAIVACKQAQGTMGEICHKKSELELML